MSAYVPAWCRVWPFSRAFTAGLAAASQLIEAERPKTITYMDDMTDEEIAAELGDLPAFFAGRKRGSSSND